MSKLKEKTYSNMILKSAKGLKRALNIQIFGGKAWNRVIYGVNWHAFFDNGTQRYTNFKYSRTTALIVAFEWAIWEVLEMCGTCEYRQKCLHAMG